MDSHAPLLFQPPHETANPDAPPIKIELLGERHLLSSPPLGLLCSSRLPGAIILKTYEIMHRLKLRSVTLVGGFHSPMERTCLDILLRGIAHVILVPARGLARMRVPVEWKTAIDTGRMALVSPFTPEMRRTTRRIAEERNQVVIRLSKRLFVPFAAHGGMTERLAFEAIQVGKTVLTFDVAETSALREHGAASIDGLEENCYLSSG